MLSIKVFDVAANQDDQENFLNEFGVEPEVFVRAVQEGQNSRQMATPNHPITAAGTNAYNDTVRALRDILLPRGWKRKSINNQEFVISPDEAVRIIVASGDEQTGVIDASSPTTKNAKGSQMSHVCANNVQLYLFSDQVSSFPQQPIPTTKGYVLLFFEDTEKQEVRLELVLPTIFTKGQIDGIVQRYILSPIPIDPKPELATLPEPDYSPNINIVIKSKAS